MKTHMEDIRLANNAGMSMPVCYSLAPMLDCDKSRLPMTSDINVVSCKHCLRMYPKKYPWARKRKFIDIVVEEPASTAMLHAGIIGEEVEQ
jgi:hypothetical protein